MRRATFVNLPVHADGALVVDLDAIHADVALARLWVLRVTHRECQILAAVFRPAFENRQVSDGGLVGDDDLLAGRVADGVRADARQLRQFRQQFRLFDDALRRAILHEVEPLLDARAQFVERGDAERPGHPLFAAEEVDDDGHIVAAHVLEEQRWPASLDDTVGDLGDFQLGGDGRGDALKLPLLLQKRYEVAQILKRHAHRCLSAMSASRIRRVNYTAPIIGNYGVRREAASRRRKVSFLFNNCLCAVYVSCGVYACIVRAALACARYSAS